MHAVVVIDLEIAVEGCLPPGAREIAFGVEMPVVQCRAIVAEDGDHANVYMCPVYKTRSRGPTYVFSATLRTKAPRPKWILAGVCIVVSEEE